MTAAPPSLLTPGRRAAVSTGLWVFGLFTTVLLIGVWGRSVAADTATLEASTRAVLESELVNERIEGWLQSGLEAAADLTPTDAAETVATLEDASSLDLAIERLVEATVTAALAPPGSPTSVDVETALEPLIPTIMDELAAREVPVDEGELRATITMLARSVLGGEEQRFVGTGSAAAARTALTRVMVVGVAGMLLGGTLAVGLSSDRRRQLRGLAIRVAISAATFAIVLRVGAWAVDPSGGRSPLAAGGAVVLGAQGHIPAIIAAVAALGATAASVAVRRRRRRMASRPSLPDQLDHPPDHRPDDVAAPAVTRGTTLLETPQLRSRLAERYPRRAVRVAHVITSPSLDPRAGGEIPSSGSGVEQLHELRLETLDGRPEGDNGGIGT